MPVEFKHATLDNGLTIIAETDPTAHTAAMGFFVRAGARDEDSAIMGVSHFLEHMMFKGTATRSAADVDLDFDNIGAVHNAYTTSELTAFWAHCLPDCLERTEEVLSDILRPAIRPEDFNDEKKVILEEIAMYRDHPFWSLYETSMEAYYAGHPLRHRVLGTEETVTALERDQMMDYFNHRYAADNITVALAGDVDFDSLAERLADHCGSWTGSGVVRSYPKLAPVPSSFTLDSDKVNQNYLLMIAPAPSLNDDRRYAAGMLMQVFGDVDGSRLYWSLVETGLAEEAQAQFDGRDGAGEYIIFCSCAPESAEEVEAIVTTEVEGLVASLTDDDLERVRSKVLTSATLHGELPAGRMRRLGRQWTYASSYRSLDEDLARMNAVTLEDLRELAVEFPVRPVVVGRLQPG